MLVSHENIILVDDNGNIISNFQPEVVSLGGSIFFSGNATSNLSIANDVDFRMGSGDFTIEWFQNQNDNNSYPRVFSIGNYPASIGVSIEGGTFYFWAGSAISFGNVAPYKNQWVHFAISRQGSSLRVFKNGIQLGSTITNTTNFNNTTNLLRIGNESTTSNLASFGGNITNFRWIKGSALYTSNFPVPTSPLTAVNNTKLLLLASNEASAYNDSSGLNKIINNSNVSWVNTKPFA
jgi:hypothetical protein